MYTLWHERLYWTTTSTKNILAQKHDEWKRTGDRNWSENMANVNISNSIGSNSISIPFDYQFLCECIFNVEKIFKEWSLNEWINANGNEDENSRRQKENSKCSCFSFNFCALYHFVGFAQEFSVNKWKNFHRNFLQQQTKRHVNGRGK